MKLATLPFVSNSAGELSKAEQTDLAMEGSITRPAMTLAAFAHESLLNPLLWQSSRHSSALLPVRPLSIFWHWLFFARNPDLVGCQNSGAWSQEKEEDSRMGG